MIYSGNLTEHLKVFGIEEIQSASGEHQTTEKYKFSIRAQRLKNREDFGINAEELFHEIRYTFKFRARAIDETDIVVYEGKRFRITSIDKYRSDMTIIVEKINE